MAKNPEAGTTAREANYDEKIAPLMAQIITICKADKIPMVASFDLTGPEDEDLRCTTILHGEDWEAPDTFREVAGLLYPPPPSFVAFTIMSTPKQPAPPAPSAAPSAP